MFLAKCDAPLPCLLQAQNQTVMKQWQQVVYRASKEPLPDVKVVKGRCARIVMPLPSLRK